MKLRREMREAQKPIRILYVCPQAHRAGHAPRTAVEESAALAEAGAEVHILTFGGILDYVEPSPLPHTSVLSSRGAFPLRIAARLLRSVPAGWAFAWFTEQVATLLSAVRLSRSLKSDLVYLRDGDPFLFIPLVLGLVFKHCRWAIFLMGSVGKRSFGSLPHMFLNAPFWKPVYRTSLSGSQFVFLCENNYVKDYFEASFLDGVLSGKVRVLPQKTERAASHVSKRAARQYLGLPEDSVLLLHFGALHAGKDIETVLEAIRDVPDVVVVHAGEVTSGVAPEGLAQRHGVADRVIIRDYYIPESEKHYYFNAAEAAILAYKADFRQNASMLWETARFGLPAIASDSGDLGELVREYNTGFVFAPEDVQSFRSALSDFIMSGEEQKQAMRASCDKFCDDFSIDRWARDCMQVLAELCAQTRSDR